MGSQTLIHLFHVFIVSSFLIYVGIKRTSLNPILLKACFIIGFGIVLLHSYKTYVKYSLGTSVWMNLLHVLLVGPLLLYIGYQGVKTSRKFFEVLLMLGFASLGYHLYYLFIEP